MNLEAVLSRIYVYSLASRVKASFNFYYSAINSIITIVIEKIDFDANASFLIFYSKSHTSG